MEHRLIIFGLTGNDILVVIVVCICVFLWWLAYAVSLVPIYLAVRAPGPMSTEGYVQVFKGLTLLAIIAAATWVIFPLAQVKTLEFDISSGVQFFPNPDTCSLEYLASAISVESDAFLWAALKFEAALLAILVARPVIAFLILNQEVAKRRAKLLKTFGSHLAAKMEERFRARNRRLFRRGIVYGVPFVFLALNSLVIIMLGVSILMLMCFT